MNRNLESTFEKFFQSYGKYKRTDSPPKQARHVRDCVTLATKLLDGLTQQCQLTPGRRLMMLRQFGIMSSDILTTEIIRHWDQSSIWGPISHRECNIWWAERPITNMAFSGH